MGHIIFDNDVERFDIDGEWYDLKRRMSHGDHRALENAYIQIAARIASKEVTVDAGQPTLLMLNIKGWSLKDQNGLPVPITSENINRLEEYVVESLTSEIDRRNERPKKKAST